MSGRVFVNNNLKVACGKVTFKDRGVPVELFALPKGSHILALQTIVKEAFNDSGTDLLDIGTKSSPAAWANDVDLSSLGAAATTLLVPGPLDVTGPSYSVYGTYTGQNSNGTAGEVEVYVTYASPFLS